MMTTNAIDRLFIGGLLVACVAMPPSIADADAEYPAVGASLGAMPAETGAAFARDDDEHKVDYSLREYHYDFGPLRGPIMEDWTPLTNKTKGDIYWTGETRQLRAVAVPKREGVNNANIDYVTSRSPITLNHKIANGTWRVVMNMGDARRGHDQMGVRAEGELISNNINSGRLEFPYVSTDGGSETPAHFEVEVTDGVLSIELFDNGGKDRYWVLTRLSLQRVK